jgi:hypothetical protein
MRHIISGEIGVHQWMCSQAINWRKQWWLLLLSSSFHVEKKCWLAMVIVVFCVMPWFLYYAIIVEMLVIMNESLDSPFK